MKKNTTTNTAKAEATKPATKKTTKTTTKTAEAKAEKAPAKPAEATVKPAEETKTLDTMKEILQKCLISKTFRKLVSEDTIAEIEKVLSLKRPKKTDVERLYNSVFEVVSKAREEQRQQKAAPEKSLKTKPKKAAPKSEVKSYSLTEKSETVNMFPAVIEDEELGTLRIASEVKTYADLKKLIDSKTDVYFAGVWTARQLRKYNYAEIFQVPQKIVPTSFPNDLDLSQTLVMCDLSDRLYAISRYTEAMYMFTAEDIPYIQDVNPYTKEKYYVRVSNGFEFEIYVPDEK